MSTDKKYTPLVLISCVSRPLVDGAKRYCGNPTSLFELSGVIASCFSLSEMKATWSHANKGESLCLLDAPGGPQNLLEGLLLKDRLPDQCEQTAHLESLDNGKLACIIGQLNHVLYDQGLTALRPDLIEECVLEDVTYFAKRYIGVARTGCIAGVVQYEEISLNLFVHDSRAPKPVHTPVPTLRKKKPPYVFEYPLFLRGEVEYS